MTKGCGALRAALLSALAIGGAFAVGGLALGQLAGGVDHLGDFAVRCLRSPLAILDATAHAGTIAAVGAVVGILIVMVRTILHQLETGGTVGRAVARARLPRVSRELGIAARQAGVFGNLDVVAAASPFAFVYGWRQPRICVSTGLVERLSIIELRAVLLHERWHVLCRDPLRLTAIGAVQAGIGVLPGFASTFERYEVEIEIAADRFVVAEMGHARWLAQALLRVASSPALPAFAGQTEARVAALVGDHEVSSRWNQLRWPSLALAVETATAVLLLTEVRLISAIGFVGLHVC